MRRGLPGPPRPFCIDSLEHNGSFVCIRRFHLGGNICRHARFILTNVDISGEAVDSYYAKAYMTERLQEAENRRLVTLSRRQPNGLSPLMRIAERWLGKSSQPIVATPVVLAMTGMAIDADCCTA